MDYVAVAEAVGVDRAAVGFVNDRGWRAFWWRPEWICSAMRLSHRIWDPV